MVTLIGSESIEYELRGAKRTPQIECVFPVSYLDGLEHDDADEGGHHEQPDGGVGSPCSPVAVHRLCV